MGVRATTLPLMTKAPRAPGSLVWGTAWSLQQGGRPLHWLEAPRILQEPSAFQLAPPRFVQLLLKCCYKSTVGWLVRPLADSMALGLGTGWLQGWGLRQGGNGAGAVAPLLSWPQEILTDLLLLIPVFL